MIKIVIDTKGGDKGPSAMIKGAALALEKFDSISVLLVGDKEYIANKQARHNLRKRAKQDGD